MDGTTKWYSYNENSLVVPQKIKNKTNIWFSSPTSGCLYKKSEINSQKDISIPMFIEVLFTNSQDMEINKMFNTLIQKMWYMLMYSILETNSAISANKDETWHYSKWNKSITERHIFYDFTYRRCLNSQNQRAEWLLPRVGDWEIGSY